MKRFWFLLCTALLLSVVATGKEKAVRIAVLSDLHVQDTAVVRSMDAEVHSTRLFNENYFAAVAALDDVAHRGIKEVILSGDLTDNGQKMNVVLIRRMLQSYTEKYDMHFYVMTGNHDPSRPFANEKVSGGLQPWGYDEIHREWSAFGFFPQKNYLYWETPFSHYSYATYSYKEAISQADWQQRTYSYPSGEGKPDYHPVISDGSYLVESVAGIWLLAIDASVYRPLTMDGDSIVTFSGASDGYNSVFQVKKYLLPWITKVVKAARQYHKVLIAFSHYPMADYNDGALKYIGEIAQPGRFDMHRFPSKKSASLLADAGVSFHVGGHLHMNDDETFISDKGNPLRNVQIPSTAGYVPAYKILTVKSDRSIRVETIPLNDVFGFDAFFNRYRKEYEKLKGETTPLVWNEAMLTSRNYREFCEWHLRELVRLRFVPNDLKEVARKQLLPMTAHRLFAHYGIKPFGQMNWSGLDMLVDFYKLRLGGQLALQDISSQRLKQYRSLIQKAISIHAESDFDKFFADFSHVMSARLAGISE